MGKETAAGPCHCVCVHFLRGGQGWVLKLPGTAASFTLCLLFSCVSAPEEEGLSKEVEEP